MEIPGDCTHAINSVLLSDDRAIVHKRDGRSQSFHSVVAMSAIASLHAIRHCARRTWVYSCRGETDRVDIADLRISEVMNSVKVGDRLGVPHLLPRIDAVWLQTKSIGMSFLAGA
jgi:hypothetical protein